MGKERLDKLLAATGRWSRREAKGLVREGRVLVDGVPAAGGEEKADPDASEILVDGVPLGYRRYTYIMLHKPAGVLTATEDRRRETVLDLLSPEPRRQQCRRQRYDPLAKFAEEPLLSLGRGDMPVLRAARWRFAPQVVHERFPLFPGAYSTLRISPSGQMT